VPQRGQAADESARVVSGAVAEERQRGVADHREDEREGDEAHRADADPLVTHRVLEHVEGHRLVFGLFERVPEQHRAHLALAQQLLRPRVGEQGLGQRGGVVLERGGDRELGLVREEPLVASEPGLHHPVDPSRRVAHLLQPLVECPVLAPVRHFLADEAGDLLLELGVGDAIGVVAHRADEEVLALGEHRRQHRHDVAHHEVTVDVVQIERRRGIGERDAPGVHRARRDGTGRCTHEISSMPVRTVVGGAAAMARPSAPLSRVRTAACRPPMSPSSAAWAARPE
jgi:hypothetical protein